MTYDVIKDVLLPLPLSSADFYFPGITKGRKENATFSITFTDFIYLFSYSFLAVHYTMVCNGRTRPVLFPVMVCLS